MPGLGHRVILIETYSAFLSSNRYQMSDIFCKWAWATNRPYSKLTVQHIQSLSEQDSIEKVIILVMSAFRNPSYQCSARKHQWSQTVYILHTCHVTAHAAAILCGQIAQYKHGGECKVVRNARGREVENQDF